MAAEICPSLRRTIDEVTAVVISLGPNLGRCHRRCPECNHVDVLGTRLDQVKDRPNITIIDIEIEIDGIRNCPNLTKP